MKKGLLLKYFIVGESNDPDQGIHEIILHKIERDKQKLKIEVELKFEAMMLDPLCGR